MSEPPIHSFREGDVYDQISRFKKGRDGSDSGSPSPPPVDLPKRLYECEGVVVGVEEDEGCGILELKGGADLVYSFFITSHCCGGRLPRNGEAILANARLVDASNRVPFLSAAVWKDGEALEEDLLEAIMADKAPLEELEKYTKLAENLFCSFGIVDKKRDNDDSDSRRNRKKVKFDDGYRSSQDKDAIGAVNDDEALELEENVDDEDVVRELTEEFPDEGVEGKLDRFMNNRIGILIVENAETKKPMPVLFNIAQVWDGESPFLENHPSWSLKQFLKPGSETKKTIKLNARDITNSYCDIGLQATAVWISEKPPSQYKILSLSLMNTLDLQLRQHLFFKTGEMEFRTNPLAGETDRMVAGRVTEYFSREMGFVSLDGGLGGTVMFHLNQVWKKDSEGIELYRSVQKESLQVHLPLDSAVMVSYRRIPAMEVNSLKYQATVLWKVVTESNAEKETDKDAEVDTLIPFEHINRYATHDNRVRLVEELDHYHDVMKNLMSLSLPPTDHRFRAVQTIINGLPFDWQAEIVAGIDLEFGIIQISHVDGIEFNISPGVKFLYVMFHIEDVWDTSGVKDPTITMPMLINNFVDLTARPICVNFEPDKLLETQKGLIEEKSAYGEIPLLQAVVVCLKKALYAEVDVSRIAQPNVLREGPGSFGLEITEFYLNATLGHRLDLKLQCYLNIPNSLQFLYERILRKIDLRSDNKIKAELRKIDSDQSFKWTHGELSGLALILPKYMTLSRNIGPIKSFKNLLVQPVLLYQRDFKTDCGVVEFIIGDKGEPIRTAAFFEQSNFISFIPKNYLVTDLTNLIQMPVKETFHAHVELAYPELPIPYIITAIWNETSRKTFGTPVPQPPVTDNREKRIYYESCRDSVVDIVRYGNVAKPAFGRDRDGRSKRKGGRGIAPYEIVWKDVVTDFYGVVLRVVNKNYALAAGIHSNGKDDASCLSFQILFDTYDVFIEEKSCSELEKNLADVIEVGDFIRFNAVRVETERSQPSRNLRYMATAVVAAKTIELIKKAKLPESVPKVTFLSQLSQSKIDNFKKIANVLNKVKLDGREEEIFHKLGSGDLAGVKEMKKSFVPIPKEKTDEEEDPLMKDFEERMALQSKEEEEEEDGIEDKRSGERSEGDAGGDKNIDKKEDSVKGNKKGDKKSADRDIPSKDKKSPNKEVKDKKSTDRDTPNRNSTDKDTKSKDTGNKDPPLSKKQERLKRKLENMEKNKQQNKREDGPSIDKVCEELTPKQIRKLVMAYMELIAKLPQKNPRNKIDTQRIAKTANLDKDDAFLEKFFLAFGQGCRKAEKGMKVGTVFVTQMQVKAVMSKGIMEPEHILREGEQVETENQTGDIFSDYSPDELRRIILSYLSLFEKKKTFQDISKDHSISVETARKLLLAITERCKEIAKNDIREVLPFKLQEVFVSAVWAKKIFSYGFTGEDKDDTEVEEITLE